MLCSHVSIYHVCYPKPFLHVLSERKITPINSDLACVVRAIITFKIVQHNFGQDTLPSPIWSFIARMVPALHLAPSYGEVCQNWVGKSFYFTSSSGFVLELPDTQHVKP